MRRRTFDALASVAGLVLAVVLAVAGGLALWGHARWAGPDTEILAPHVPHKVTA
jgi:hypothetical protein